jgi:hypothetical protein
MNNFKSLVEARQRVQTPQIRIRKYIQEEYDANPVSAKQLKATGARDAVEHSLTGDLWALTFKVRDRARSQGDDEVVSKPGNEILKEVQLVRATLLLSAQGNQAYQMALANEEAAKGLQQTQGTA